MKKKIIILLLTITLGLSLISCSKKKEDTPAEPTPIEPTPNPNPSEPEEDKLEFSETDNTEEKVKASAKKQFKETYDEKYDSLSESNKIILDLKIAEYYIYIEASSGSIEEMKEDLSKKYDEMIELLESFDTVYETLIDKKAAIIIELEYVYNNYKGKYQIILSTDLDDMYTLLKQQINDMTEESQLNQVFVTFKTQVMNRVTELYAKLKEQYKLELDGIVEKVKEKIDDIELKELLSKALDTAKEKIDQLSNPEQFEEDKKSIKETLEEKIKEIIPKAIAKAKEVAKEELQKAKVKVSDYVKDDDITSSINTLIDTTYGEIDKLNDLDSIKESIKTITDTFIVELNKLGEQQLIKYKNIGIDYIKEKYTELISYSTNQELNTIINTYVEEQYKTIRNITELSQVEESIEKIKESTVQYFTEQATKILVEIKNSAITDLSNLAKKYTEKITDVEIQNTINGIIDDATKSIKAIEKLEDCNKAIEEIKQSVTTRLEELLKKFQEAVLAKAKEETIKLINQASSALEGKLPDQDSKDTLSEETQKMTKTINDLTYTEDYQTQLDNLVKQFEESLKNISKQVITSYALIAQGEIAAYQTALINFLNENDQTEVANSVTKFFEELNAITTVEGIKALCDKVVADFKAEVNVLIQKAINIATTEAKEKLKVEVDKCLLIVKLEEYTKKFNDSYTTVCNTLDELTNILTVAQDIATISLDYQTTLLNLQTEYWTAYTPIVIKQTQDEAAQYKADALLSEEYLNKNIITQKIADVAITVADTAFAKIEDLPANPAIETECQKLLDAYKLAIDKAVGRTTEEN